MSVSFHSRTFFVVCNAPLLPSPKSAQACPSVKRCARPFIPFLSSKSWQRPVCTLARLPAIFHARHGELHLRRNGPHGPLLYNHGPFYGPGSGHIFTDILNSKYVRVSCMIFSLTTVARHPQKRKYPQPLASAPHATKSVHGSLNTRRALFSDLNSQLSVSYSTYATSYD